MATLENCWDPSCDSIPILHAVLHSLPMEECCFFPLPTLQHHHSKSTYDGNTMILNKRNKPLQWDGQRGLVKAWAMASKRGKQLVVLDVVPRTNGRRHRQLGCGLGLHQRLGGGKVGCTMDPEDGCSPPSHWGHLALVGHKGWASWPQGPLNPKAMCRYYPLTRALGLYIAPKWGQIGTRNF